MSTRLKAKGVTKIPKKREELEAMYREHCLE
jgi:hypothetical protein